MVPQIMDFLFTAAFCLFRFHFCISLLSLLFRLRHKNHLDGVRRVTHRGFDTLANGEGSTSRKKKKNQKKLFLVFWCFSAANVRSSA